MKRTRSNNAELTHTVGRIEFKADIARPGDLVIYTQKPWAMSYRVRKFYGLVTKVERETLWITSTCTDGSVYDAPTEFGIPAEYSDCIIEIIRNAEVYRK